MTYFVNDENYNNKLRCANIWSSNKTNNKLKISKLIDNVNIKSSNIYKTLEPIKEEDYIINNIKTQCVSCKNFKPLKLYKLYLNFSLTSNQNFNNNNYIYSNLKSTLNVNNNLDILNSIHTNVSNKSSCFNTILNKNNASKTYCKNKLNNIRLKNNLSININKDKSLKINILSKGSTSPCTKNKLNTYSNCNNNKFFNAFNKKILNISFSKIENEENKLLYLKELSNKIRKHDKNNAELDFIVNYLKSNKEIKSIIQPNKEDVSENTKQSEELINKIAKSLLYEKTYNNQIIFKYGDKADKFYIILRGQLSVLVPIKHEVMMNQTQFFYYLCLLSYYQEYELLRIVFDENSKSFANFPWPINIFIPNNNKSKINNKKCSIYDNQLLINFSKNINKLKNRNFISKIKKNNIINETIEKDKLSKNNNYLYFETNNTSCINKIQSLNNSNNSRNVIFNNDVNEDDIEDLKNKNNFKINTVCFTKKNIQDVKCNNLDKSNSVFQNSLHNLKKYPSNYRKSVLHSSGKFYNLFKYDQVTNDIISQSSTSNYNFRNRAFSLMDSSIKSKLTLNNKKPINIKTLNTNIINNKLLDNFDEKEEEKCTVVKSNLFKKILNTKCFYVFYMYWATILQKLIYRTHPYDYIQRIKVNSDMIDYETKPFVAKFALEKIKPQIDSINKAKYSNIINSKKCNKNITDNHNENIKNNATSQDNFQLLYKEFNNKSDIPFPFLINNENKESLDNNTISNYNNNNTLNNTKESLVKVKTIIYKEVIKLKTGQKFGDVAFTKTLVKRTGTIIACEDTDLAYMSKDDYQLLLKEFSDHIMKKNMQLITSSKLFCGVSLSFLKNNDIMNLFVKELPERNTFLLRENDVIKHYYFVKSGSVEIIINKSLQELDNLIVKYGGNIQESDEYIQSHPKFLKYYQSERIKKKLFILQQREYIGLEDMSFSNKKIIDNINDFEYCILNKNWDIIKYLEDGKEKNFLDFVRRYNTNIIGKTKEFVDFILDIITKKDRQNTIQFLIDFYYYEEIAIFDAQLTTFTNELFKIEIEQFKQIAKSNSLVKLNKLEYIKIRKNMILKKLQDIRSNMISFIENFKICNNHNLNKFTNNSCESLEKSLTKKQNTFKEINLKSSCLKKRNEIEFFNNIKDTSNTNDNKYLISNHNKEFCDTDNNIVVRKHSSFSNYINLSKKTISNFCNKNSNIENTLNYKLNYNKDKKDNINSLLNNLKTKEINNHNLNNTANSLANNKFVKPQIKFNNNITLTKGYLESSKYNTINNDKTYFENKNVNLPYINKNLNICLTKPYSNIKLNKNYTAAEIKRKSNLVLKQDVSWNIMSKNNLIGCNITSTPKNNSLINKHLNISSYSSTPKNIDKLIKNKIANIEKNGISGLTDNDIKFMKIMKVNNAPIKILK